MDYTTQLEKLIACLHGPSINKGRQNKNPVAGCLVVLIGITKEMDETRNYYLIQYIYQETF